MRDSDSVGVGLKVKPISKCIAVFAGGLIAILVLFAWADNSIQNAPVYVSVRTNPPPQFATLLGTNSNFSVLVPIALVNQPPVTEAEVLKIKRAIPRLQTVGRLYLPYSIGIGSPTNAVAEFWRRRKPLSVFLVKSDGVWKAESIAGGVAHFSTPPDLLDRLSNRAP